VSAAEPLPEGAQLLLDVAEVLDLRYPATAAKLDLLASWPTYKDVEPAKRLLRTGLSPAMLACLPPALCERIGLAP
jgi:hypothetical protein